MSTARPVPHERMRLALAALAGGSFICVSMLVGRKLFFGEWKFIFLIGNLFLAWMPLLFAVPIYKIRARREHRPWMLAGCAAIWFFFYPNAPYLITDLVHLKTRAPVPRWYDLILFMSFAWTGLFLGNLSLYLLQEVIRAWRGRAMSWVFAGCMLVLGAFGVFVGRFWRWNSWEVLTSPFGLAGDALKRISKMSLGELGLFTAVFFAFSALTYITLYTLTHLHGYVDPPVEDEEPKSTLPSSRV